MSRTWIRRWIARPVLAVALVVPACTLAPPKYTPHGGTGGMNAMCSDETDGGVDALDDSGDDNDGGTDAGAGVVITPVACAGTGPNPNAIDRYSQGYTPSQDILDRVQATVSTMTDFDLAQQMRGTPYSGTSALQYNDIQRSKDTGSIRGFRYRDASRGMNLGEDMDGIVPNAGDGQRPARRLLDRIPGQHGARRGLRSRSRVRHRRGDRRRDAGRQGDAAARPVHEPAPPPASGAARRRPTARIPITSAAWPPRWSSASSSTSPPTPSTSWPMTSRTSARRNNSADGRADAARDLRAPLPHGGAGRRRRVGHGLVQLGERHSSRRRTRTR